jgi:hypothetical protein
LQQAFPQLIQSRHFALANFWQLDIGRFDR